MRVFRSQKSLPVVLAFTLAVSNSLFADFTYQQTTQITGGSIVTMMKMMGAFSSQARKANEPVVSTIYLKGNRMADVSRDSIEIIDLDAETITNVDLIKHTYTVMTFQQIKEQMERAREEMKKKQAEQAAKTPPPANPNAQDVKMSYDVHVRKTGAAKQISGLDANETIMTLMMNATDQKTQQTAGAMAITNDMWLVPEIPGYSELRDFHIRMAQKMDIMNSGLGMDISKMLLQSPGAGQALADMGKEMQKIQGVPIMQIMRMGATADGKPLPAASEAPLPANNSPAMPSGSEIAKQSAVSALNSRLPFGGFHKKQAETPPPAQDPNQPPPATAAVLMESQTSVSSFSSASVDSSHFEVPAGFKQIQPQSEKH